MQQPFEVWFRLSPAGQNHGVSCDGQGAFVGPVALLERKSGLGGGEQWQPRPPDELDAELSACFGLPVDVSRKAEGLAAIARALNRDDLVLAQIATLHLQFPDPPVLTKAARSQGDTIELARLLYRGELLKEDWDPAEHPRWPAGSPGGIGGEFAPAGASDEASNNDSSEEDDDESDDDDDHGFPEPPDPSIIPAEAIMPAQMTASARCDEEWASAEEFCRRLIKNPAFGLPPYSWMGRNLSECMRGQVSEECGGNRVRF
jgi:hypothetical protein